MPAPSGKTTMLGSLSSRLSELGIELPKPPKPLGRASKPSRSASQPPNAESKGDHYRTEFGISVAFLQRALHPPVSVNLRLWVGEGRCHSVQQRMEDPSIASRDGSN